MIPAATTTDSSDPYHTDIHPNNIYSEEYLYDAEGNLIGKTTTIPTAFGPDAIWINDRAYYDVPGFSLVEWSGPGQRTEAYNMYESGVQVGIMGDEDEVPTWTAATAQPETCPEPTARSPTRPSMRCRSATAPHRTTSPIPHPVPGNKLKPKLSRNPHKTMPQNRS